MRLGGPRKPNVRKLRKRGDLDGLREALRYRETKVDDGIEWDVGVATRLEATDALGDFHVIEAAAALGDAVQDPVPAVRVAAIEALSKVNLVAAVEPLVNCVIGLPDAEGGAPARALELLVAWQLEGTPEVLVERLLEPDAPELNDWHREALDALLEADPRQAEARVAIADRAVAILTGPQYDTATETAAHILASLGSGAAGSVLGPLTDGAATPALVRAAGSLGDARLVEPVIRRLGSDDPVMRQAAASAAGGLNHTLAVPALLTATQDAEQAVRDAASDALNAMGMAAIIAGLAEIVKTQTARALPPQPPPGAGAQQATAEGPEPAAQIPPPPAPPPTRSGGLVERLLGPRR